MVNSKYIINGDNAAKLISSNVYNPVSSIVEIIANYYDADATEVKICFKEKKDSNEKDYIYEIIITGDGNGFEKEALENLMEIGDSNKKTDRYTKKFKRVKLGSFGIALTSFQNLGDTLEIYSRTKLGRIFYRSIFINNGYSVFSDISEDIKYSEKVKYKTGCTFIIKNCKIRKSMFLDFELLKNKLAYLPIDENFKIYLNGNEQIKRLIIGSADTYKLTFSFTIDENEYKGYVYYSKQPIRNRYFRGVFLEVDGRILDWNIFNDIRQNITSPGAVENRIQGYIIANNLRDKINASRTGLTDINLSLSIADNLKKNISNINKKAKEFYAWKKDKSSSNKANKNTNKTTQLLNKKLKESNNITQSTRISIYEEEQYYKSMREDRMKKRIRNINSDLNRLGIKFKYEPESEIEVIIIASQLCQKELLDFQIIQAISSESPDSIIMKNGKMAFLEFELTLNNFYAHKHNHHIVDYIVCWDINRKTIKKESDVYLKQYSKYLKSIEYSKNEKSKYCDEIVFENFDGSKNYVELYVLNEIISRI